MTRPAEPTPLPAFRVLIPARMASTRLPGKPLADLNGLPMVVWVAKRAELSGAQAVIVATDAPEVSTACERHVVCTVMTAADHLSGSDRLAEAVTALGWADGDVVVNVQGDEPLMDPALRVRPLMASPPFVVLLIAPMVPSTSILASCRPLAVVS